jgi:predicted DNA-binding ribbon-helix-helix protein
MRESKTDKEQTYEYHRFLDEAGDTTFYGKGKLPILGTNGVSNSFTIGMVRFLEPLPEVRSKILQLQKEIEISPLFKSMGNVKKRVNKGGFYFHAKDDSADLKKEFFDFILNINCTFQAIVARKSVERFKRKHNDNEAEFYADLLSHLLKDKFNYNKLVLNVAERQNSTSNKNIERAIKIASERYIKKNPDKQIQSPFVYSVHKFQDEPLLCVADYLCWVVQRVFETGEIRFYEYMQPKISLVVDLYDVENYTDWKNYYSARNPLTPKNKIGPLSP